MSCQTSLAERSPVSLRVSHRSVGTFARALDCSSSVRQPSLHMSAAAASRDITLVRCTQRQKTCVESVAVMKEMHISVLLQAVSGCCQQALVVWCNSILPQIFSSYIKHKAEAFWLHCCTHALPEMAQCVTNCFKHMTPVSASHHSFTPWTRFMPWATT